MSARWITLASGSAGNASYLECAGRGVLIDIGLGPRQLTKRLHSVEVGWEQVSAVVLTHTHGDHWDTKTLALLRELQLPLYCHTSHRRELQLRAAEAFQELQFAQLVTGYDAGSVFSPLAGLAFRPLRLSHDGGPTFGFRIDGAVAPQEKTWSVGYVADLGCWDSALVGALTDVDLLALEFNHDVDLQRASRRPHWLKARVLGDFGHLSNVQAAHLLRACLKQSSGARLRHVVQLHLSRDCNRPELAAAAASEVLAQCGHTVSLQTAQQGCAGDAIWLSDVVATASA
ncbi:MAG: MBL fold metallo-hydrolase [Planctomycetaceae bacterium]